MLILAVPILDTTLVTIVRLLEGRPVSQGGRDHSSHRLVSLGVSETGAVVLLGLISAALGATSLAYEAFGSGRVAAVGVLVTFALLIQFGSFLADVDRVREPGSTRVTVYVRRLAEVAVDGALIAASFLAAYLLRFNGIGTPNQRHYFLLTLPVILLCRYVALLLFGMYAGVWRYASARDALRAGSAVVVSEVGAVGIVALTQGPLGDFSRSVFVDRRADLRCGDHHGSLRRARDRALRRPRPRTVGAPRADRRRRPDRPQPAPRAARDAWRARDRLRRRLSRAARTPAERCQGRRRRRRAIEQALERFAPDIVFVTIPNAPHDRLGAVVDACARHETDCRFVRRDLDLDPQVSMATEPR